MSNLAGSVRDCGVGGIVENDVNTLAGTITLRNRCQFGRKNI